jgi:hypothetical protein
LSSAFVPPLPPTGLGAPAPLRDPGAAPEGYDGFDQAISTLLARDPKLGAMLSKLGPRIDLIAGTDGYGAGHVASTGLDWTPGARLVARMVVDGSGDYRQALRVFAAPCDADPVTWQPVVEVADEAADDWRRLSPKGDAPMRIGVQGRWTHRAGVRGADPHSRWLGTAVHRDGRIALVRCWALQRYPSHAHKTVMLVMRGPAPATEPRVQPSTEPA